MSKMYVTVKISVLYISKIISIAYTNVTQCSLVYLIYICLMDEKCDNDYELL